MSDQQKEVEEKKQQNEQQEQQGGETSAAAKKKKRKRKKKIIIIPKESKPQPHKLQIIRIPTMPTITKQILSQALSFQIIQFGVLDK